MRLAISNIAWSPAEDAAVASLMQRHGFTGVEIAPTKLWPRPLEASDADIDAYAAFWRARGVEVSSMQALLFGRPDLVIFEGADKRRETLEYLEGIIRLGGRIGARALVFGSPRNRRVGDLPREQAEAIAVEFFRDIGRAAVEHETVFCIEPNPIDYGCDFVTDSAEGRNLVAKVDHPGFGLHLDAAGMTMAGEDVEAALRAALPGLCHFHISEPQLGPIGSGGVDHAVFARVLDEGGYARWRSVEMRAPGEDGNIAGVEQAMRVVRERYG